MGGLKDFITGDYGGDGIDAGVRAQEQAANRARGDLNASWNDQQRMAQPFVDAGKTGLSQLASGDFMKNWQQDPGYQFRLQQGQQAIQGSAAARGLNGSGATMKALAGYGQNLASEEYGKQYDRQSQRLTGLANLGAGMTSNLMSGAQNHGNSMAGVSTGVGNAQAAGHMAHAQGRQNMAGGWANIAGSALGAATGVGLKKYLG